MGTSQSKPKQQQNHPYLHTPPPGNDYSQEVQMEGDVFSCCGVKINRGKKNHGGLNWEDTALLACMRYGDQLMWANDVLHVVKNKADNRRKFIREYNDIKYLQKQPTKLEQHAPLTGNQISAFKSNLKKSVLLHPVQVLNPAAQRNSLRPQINPYNSMAKGQSLQKSMIKDQNPYKSLIKQQKQRANKASFINNPQKNTTNGNKSLIANNISPNQPQPQPHQYRDDSFLSISKIAKSVHRENLRESVIGLVDDTMSSLFKGQEQEVLKMNAYQLQMFVKFTVMLQKHLKDQQHKICLIIQVFYQTLYKRYPYYVQAKQEKTKKLSEQEIAQFIDTIKYFLEFISHLVLDYYNLSQSVQNMPGNKDHSLSVIQMKSFHSNGSQETTNYLINNYENVLTIVTAILFKDQKFYHFVFEAFRMFNKEHDQRANMLFEKLHGREPQFFSVRKQYCLNSGTLKNILQGMSVQSNIQNLDPQDLQSTTEQPYKKCSQTLLKLQKSRTPISKMKSILESAEKITQTIMQFYENNNRNINVNYKMIDADQVLSIFCYILSISKIENVYSHCFFIQQFATEFQKMSMTGYYYSVLCCAVQEDFGEERVGSMRKLQEKQEEEKENKKQGKLMEKKEKQEMVQKNNEEKGELSNLDINHKIQQDTKQLTAPKSLIQSEPKQKQDNLQITLQHSKQLQYKPKAVTQSFCMGQPGINIGSGQL